MLQRYSHPFTALIFLLALLVPALARAQSSSMCCCALSGPTCLSASGVEPIEVFIEACSGTPLAETYDDTDSDCLGEASDGCASACEAALPVEMISFQAISDGRTVVLKWTTASEINNAGFSIEQEIDPGGYAEVGYVQGRGTTNEQQQYGFAVTDVDPGVHRFRLKQVDFDGSFEYSAVVEAAVTVPGRFLIEAAYPNPFNPTTTLGFAAGVSQHIDVTLLNIAGQAIRTLFSGTVSANEMQYVDVDAGSLPSGTYLVHLEGSDLTATERIVLAK